MPPSNQQKYVTPDTPNKIGLSYLAFSRLTLTLNGMTEKYRLHAPNDTAKKQSNHFDLTTNDKVVFNLCSLLIATILYHTSKDWCMYEYTFQ